MIRSSSRFGIQFTYNFENICTSEGNVIKRDMIRYTGIN